MSLGKTLLKVAIGVAIVKGVSTLAKGGGATAGTAGRGTPFGKDTSGGLDDILKDALGTGSGSRRQGGTDDLSGGGSDGAGDLLDQITGGGDTRDRSARTGRDSDQGDGRIFTPTPRPPPRRKAPDDDQDDMPRDGSRPGEGGLGGLLEEIIRGGASGGRSPSPTRDSDQGDGHIFTPTPRPPRRNAPKGGLEDMLRGGTGPGQEGSGGLLEAVLGGKGPVTLEEPKARRQELAAALALRAMIQAVKCDGELDAAEKRKLTEQLGEATREEVAFVNGELQRPVDLEGLARQVPNGMEEQVYVVSLMAIDLDNQREAKYLAGLAQALDLSPDEVNRLHDRLSAPRMFR